MASSTGIKTAVSFPDLSLQSQMLYLALLETWRVVRMMVEEHTGVVYQEERGETGLLLEDILTELEDMEDCPQTDKVDTKIAGVQIKTALNKDKRSRDNLPDLIQNTAEVPDRPVAVSPQPLPDLVSSCGTRGGERSNTSSWRDPRSSGDPGNCLPLLPTQEGSAPAPSCLDNSDIASPVPTTPPSQSADSSPAVRAASPRLSGWAQVGRQLDRIAGEPRLADRAGSSNESY